MCTSGGFQGSSKQDMSLLYSPNFKYSDGGFRKNQDFMDLNNHNFHQQQQQYNSGLTRYRSAPSSFIDNLLDATNEHGGGGGGGGGNTNGCEDFQYFRSSSPEMDTMLARFVSAYNGSGDSVSHDLQDFAERPAMKQKVADPEMVYQSLPEQSLPDDNSVSVGNSLDRTLSVMDSMALKNSVQATKMNNANGSNILRQNSSPAGLFSNLGAENGFPVMRDVGGFTVGSGTNGEATPTNARLSNQVFSSTTRILPQIAEVGEKNITASSPDVDVRKRQYLPNFDSWPDASSNGLKRARENNRNMFLGLNALHNQSGNSGNHVIGLTHHLSLPKNASQMATIDKFMQFQGSVPCKIRAKRGCATHPRSIAERVRRTRISERMRKLQELFPNMDKQTNTADMLDLAVEYIKDLQKQVKTLTDTRAMCTCSSKQKQYSNSSV